MAAEARVFPDVFRKKPEVPYRPPHPPPIPQLLALIVWEKLLPVYCMTYPTLLGLVTGPLIVISTVKIPEAPPPVIKFPV
jgi:hypothetical protein